MTWLFERERQCLHCEFEFQFDSNLSSRVARDRARQREREHSGVCQSSLSDLKVEDERAGCGLVSCT